MHPDPSLLAPDDGERHCAIESCDQPPCFQTHLERSGHPTCACATRSANACAAHLVDVIHKLARWSQRNCPHPTDVTVYATDHKPAPTTNPQAIAVTTIRLPPKPPEAQRPHSPESPG